MAVGKWNELITLPYCVKPSTNTIAFLAGISRVSKNELNQIWQKEEL